MKNMLGLLVFWATYYYDQKKNIVNFLDMMIGPIGIYFVLEYIKKPYNIYERIVLGMWIIRMLQYHWHFFNKYPKYYSIYLLYRMLVG